MKNRKKGDIAYKFSFSLIFCINAYFHLARNQSVFWKNEMSLSLLKDWKGDKETPVIKMIMVARWETSYGGLSRLFSKSVHTYLWNKPLQVSERVAFAEFEWKYYIYLSVKTGDWSLKILLFNYWNDLALGSVETYFREVGAYVSLKRAATGVWEGNIC